MSYKIGDTFYLKGTKQRFIIVDYDLGGHLYLCAFKDRRYAYLSYMQKKVSEDELIEKYIPIKE